MSVVTTLIIATSNHEGEEDAQGNDIYPAIDRLNELLGGGQWFKPVHDFAGGNKAPQAYAFMAAINHLDFDVFLGHMRQAGWDEPGEVVLLANKEQAPGFSVVDWR